MKNQETVYYFQDGKVQACSYEEFVFEFGKDETTSPRGVENREFIREHEEGWQLCTWGAGGNNFRVLETFETEEEAEEALFKTYEYEMGENWDAPRYYHSAEELIASEYSVNKEVAESLWRKMQKIEARREEIKKEINLKSQQERAKKLEQEKADRIAAGLSPDKADATRQQWTPEMQTKFSAYIQSKGLKNLSNREANSIAWKKQNWFIGNADVCTLRSLLKSTF